MKNYLFNLKYVAVGALVSLASCVNDDLPEVGDLEDITGPTPFYSYSDVSSSEFDCNEVELSANYDYFFQGGTNLAVNGTMYDWTITTDEPGIDVADIELINKDLPVLEQSIAIADAAVVGIQSEIDKIEFKIPCETDPAKAAVMQAEVDALKVDLAAAEAARTPETIATIDALNEEILNLPAATLQDRELIFGFPTYGDYNVGLKVTDNLGKSTSTVSGVTVFQAVPTVPVPEIGEAGFEDADLFDKSGDGRDSWRSPSSSRWGSVFQINEDKSEAADRLPEGVQAAKFPPDGTRTGYQEIEVTPGATYVLTYFSTVDPGDNYGDITVSIINPAANSLVEAQDPANIIASRTTTNENTTQDVFSNNAITFEVGDLESVIILLTNSPGTEGRLDAFQISVKQ
ncbi:hypothetical protein Q4566_09765 [Tamlana sp. 2_MG-2023]|uniref:hypothetical protein n=1 Tax=unclassified Tamlana TaxID=2614803 RepID=UPI0026E49602|nr:MULTISPECIES: hypothetical protein [unclassified Tamlana]MDO6760483.1 hypothetical protein [Tamlana sp. 2_MG-2023]MDO6790739.1 hypothetical protein [Tamlana sp. 1_MG-2023]